MHQNSVFYINDIDTAEMIGKNGKTLFEAEVFKVNKAGGVERPILVLIGAQVVFALVKD